MSERPNVIWILGDEHRGQALSCNGDPNVSTPNIDRLAVLGMNFTNAVTPTPLCCPARGCMLTGQFPQHCVPGHERQLPPQMPTVASVLREHGYRTAYFGKWHLDGFHESEGRAAFHLVPPERRGGFAYWLGYENNNSPFDSWVHGGDGAAEQGPVRLRGYETDALTDCLIEYLERAGEQPFFAVLSVQPPHPPYLAPEEEMGRHNPGRLALRPNVPCAPSVQETARRDLAGYYGQIENLDRNVGRILRALEKTGLSRRTHLVFFSDHGDMMGSHGQYRKMTPYQEAISVPFIIGGEQLRYNGRQFGRSDALVSLVDLAPTTLGLCGIDKPSWMPGNDFSGYRLAERPRCPAPESVYLTSGIPTCHGDSVDKPWDGVITSDGWKYVALDGVDWMMYNLREDPFEQVNMAHNSRYAAQRKRLSEFLRAWRERAAVRPRFDAEP